MPNLLVISDHLPIPARPKTYKATLGLLKTLSRQWSVYFYYTDPFGTERTYQEHLRRRTYRSNVSQRSSPAKAGGPGIQIFPPFFPQADQKTALRGLKEFLSSHDIDLILFLGCGTAQAYLCEIQLFYRHRPIACLFFHPREATDGLNLEKMEVMERIRALRSLEELHNLSDRVFVNSKSCAGKHLNQALKGLMKKTSQKAAAPTNRTSVIFIADGPRHMVQRSFRVLKRNTPSAKEWIRVGKGNLDEVNKALRRARGEFIALLRSSSLVTPGWLEGLLRCFADPRVGAVRPFGDGKRDHFSGLWTKGNLSQVLKDLARLSAAWSLNHVNEKKGPAHLNNSCWVLRRSAMERVGLLDRRFQWGDLAYWDYSLRLRQAGFRMASADDVVVPGTNLNDHQNSAQREMLAEKWVDAELKILDELDGDTKDKG